MGLNPKFKLGRQAGEKPKLVFFWPRFWDSILKVIPLKEPPVSK